MLIKVNNKGMSLLELIISMAVSAIVVLMIITFISGALRIFQTTNNDVNLQMEAQTALNQLTKIIMEAGSIPASVNMPEGNEIRYRICNEDAIGSDYAIIYKKDVKKLYLVSIEDTVTIDSNISYTDEDNLLAEYVADFSISELSSDSKNRKGKYNNY